jgi:hypothetical protein
MVHDDLAVHASLKVTGDEAGIFKFAALGKFPEDLSG